MEELLGAHLFDDTSRDQGVLLTRLKTHYKGLILIEIFTEQEKIIKTIWNIMLLIGLFLFPDNSGCSLHIIHLPFLTNMDRRKTYNWSSACLSYLYRFLCKNAKKYTSIFYGCVVLLQA